jgi:hypothetical protein
MNSTLIDAIVPLPLVVTEIIYFHVSVTDLFKMFDLKTTAKSNFGAVLVRHWIRCG